MEKPRSPFQVRGSAWLSWLGRLEPQRLVGDDTDDDRRLDAMISVPGVLAVLERQR